MARADLLSILYTKKMSPLEFHFESLRPPVGLYDLLSPYDIRYMNSIATNPKLASKISKKTKLLNEVMESRNFRKLVQGTNRICYKNFTYPEIVCKVAIDRVGLKDTPDEFRNQMLLKPFITKVFEVSEFGQVGMFERVEPITSLEQFMSIAPDVFDLIYKFLSNNTYALEDIGSDYYLNYGLRKGFGPVLLDFPYLVELDPAKLVCHNKDPYSPTGYCLGEIDYDIGFNNFICTKCGKRVFAKELAKEPEEDNQKFIKKIGGPNMKIKVTRGNNVVMERDLGNNMKKTNFIPTKSRVKITHDGSDVKVEEVASDYQPKNEEPKEVIPVVKEEPVKERVVTVKPAYKDHSERDRNYHKDNRPRQDKPYKQNNNKKYLGRNDPGYYNRSNMSTQKNNKDNFNNNTSVSDSPVVESNIYKNKDMIDPAPVETNVDPGTYMDNTPDIKDLENQEEQVVENKEYIQPQEKNTEDHIPEEDIEDDGY